MTLAVETIPNLGFQGRSGKLGMGLGSIRRAEWAKPIPNPCKSLDNA